MQILMQQVWSEAKRSVCICNKLPSDTSTVSSPTTFLSSKSLNHKTLAINLTRWREAGSSGLLLCLCDTVMHPFSLSTQVVLMNFNNWLGWGHLLICIILICCSCQFPWCKYFHNSSFSPSHVMLTGLQNSTKFNNQISQACMSWLKYTAGYGAEIPG